MADDKTEAERPSQIAPNTVAFVTSHPVADLNFPGEELVIAVVPKKFKLTLKSHGVIDIPAGTMRLPKSIAEEWWAKVNGVTIFEGTVDEAALTEGAEVAAAALKTPPGAAGVADGPSKGPAIPFAPVSIDAIAKAQETKVNPDVKPAPEPDYHGNIASGESKPKSVADKVKPAKAATPAPVPPPAQADAPPPEAKSAQ